MFDNSMSSGTPALIAWLTAATLLLIVVFAVILTISGLRQRRRPTRGFFHELFYTLLHALDPGTIGGDAGSWPFLLTMLALTLGGLFIVSALIGVLASGIDTKLADLRRGRSIVLEEDHTVILGWSESIFTIISELTLANESRKDPVIVILADRDKVDMEEELKVKVPERRGTQIICRSGSPMDLDDLRLSSHDTARSVILLAPDSDDPDSEVIKTLLALTHGGEDGPADRRRDPGPEQPRGRRARRQGPDHAARHPRDRRQAGRADLAPVRCRGRLHRAVRLLRATSSTSSRTTAWPARRTPRRSRPSRRRRSVGIVDGGDLEAQPAAGHRHHRRADPDRRRRGRLGARGPVRGR